MRTLNLAVATIALAVAAVPALAAQQSGDRSFVLSGSGSSDKDFDSNAFGMNGQIGWFTSDSLELGIRQDVIASKARKDDTRWNGSTLLYADWNFGQETVVPFLGVNLGAVYGEDVKDTSAAGLEAGLKFYVLDKTFISAKVQYEFLFDDANDIDSRFNNGAFFYTLGVGFNF